MVLTLGAQHVCTGTGSVAIARPLGLRAVLTGIPASAAAEPGTPLIYHQFRDVGIGARDRGLGRISLGVTSLGYMEALDLVVTPQLVYPLADEFNLLAWSIVPGVTATIDEIVRPAVLNSALEPWDRNPQPIAVGGGIYVPGPIALTTTYTYTVPTGKRLFLSSARARLTRLSAATSVVVAEAIITVGAVSLVLVYAQSNIVGAIAEDGMQGGPLIVPAGTVLNTQVRSTDTGGAWAGHILFNDFLFDA